MNDPDRMLREHYKSETDEFLFNDVHFDSRMMEEVRSKVHTAAKQSTRTGRFDQRRMRWMYGTIGTMMVAAAMILLIITLPSLDTPPSTSQPPTGTLAPLNSPLIVDDSQRVLQNAEEAKSLYGEGLHLPTYIPKAYVNNRIEAFNITKDGTSKVIFTYETDNKNYLLSVEKNASLENFMNDEKIEINDVTGYIFSDANMTTLYWLVDDNLYSINGMLSREETLKVARSINKE
jgi:hypothetical protein